MLPEGKAPSRFWMRSLNAELNSTGVKYVSAAEASASTLTPWTTIRWKLLPPLSMNRTHPRHLEQIFLRLDDPTLPAYLE